MAISLVSVGQKWTATIANAIINAVNAQGRPLITPTSVAGTGVSLSGAKVVVAAASSVSVNGCFTSAYENYAIEYDLTTSGNASFAGTLRLSGTDATTAYDTQRESIVNATPTAAQSLNGSSFVIDVTAITGRHTGTIKLYSPALAVATIGLILSGSTANPMTSSAGSLYHGIVQHRTATAYDGFTITPSTGTITGSVRVYGIA